MMTAYCGHYIIASFKYIVYWLSQHQLFNNTTVAMPLWTVESPTQFLSHDNFFAACREPPGKTRTSESTDEGTKIE